MQKQKTKNKLLALLAIVTGTLLLTTALVFWNPLEKWQLKLTNRFYDRNEPSDEIVIVGIDAYSVSDEGLGRFQDWSRTYYAQVIENLETAGAKVIGFDMIFTNESQGIPETSLEAIAQSNPTLTEYFQETMVYLESPHPDDQTFADALSRYDNIAIMSNLSLEEDEIINVPMLELFRTEVYPVSGLFFPDKDNTRRRIPLEVTDSTGETFPAMSKQVVELYLDPLSETLDDFLKNQIELITNYSGGPYNYKILSFADIYENSFSPENIEGKIVLIGSTTRAVEDHFPTPTTRSDLLMPGVEVHANAIQTLLEQNFLFEQSKPSQLLTIAALTILLTAAVMALGILPGLFAAIALITGYHLAAEPIFDQGLILNLVYPTIALFTAYLATTLYKYLTETKEKQELKSAFGKYVNKDLVEQIIDHPEQLKLGGDRRTVTVFFSDIENFTHFSEQLTPEALVAQLNEYFEVMTDIVLQRGGTLDKFEGDAIMAFWGAPLPQPEHAQRAAESALACRAALADLHAKWTATGKPLLNFRVGLATGDAIAGNIGSKERFDYTVMGDIVNLGARLEGANKEYGTRIMVSQATADALHDQFELRCLDRLRVKGKDNAIEIYELMSAKGQLAPEHHALVGDFQTALNFYFQGDFEEAEKQFKALAEKIPHDGPTQTYLKRCATLKVNHPTDWQGVWTLEHK